MCNLVSQQDQSDILYYSYVSIVTISWIPIYCLWLEDVRTSTLTKAPWIPCLSSICWISKDFLKNNNPAKSKTFRCLELSSWGTHLTSGSQYLLDLTWHGSFLLVQDLYHEILHSVRPIIHILESLDIKNTIVATEAEVNPPPQFLAHARDWQRSSSAAQCAPTRRSRVQNDGLECFYGVVLVEDLHHEIAEAGKTSINPVKNNNVVYIIVTPQAQIVTQPWGDIITATRVRNPFGQAIYVGRNHFIWS